jgi:NADH dehydrogenase
MVATNGRTVTVFGGIGFLGRRIVRHLRYRGFPVRIASRHPGRGHRHFGSDDPQLQSVQADIQDERSVADALTDAYGAVNAVSLYVEHGKETFHSVHVESAQRVAVQAHRAGVKRLVHVSGIGADAASPSRYIRKRGEGELAVRAAFIDTLFVRPAVMFGPDDAFLTTIVKLLRKLPIYPMFGSGRTRLHPANVEDVAEAVARVMARYPLFDLLLAALDLALREVVVATVHGLELAAVDGNAGLRQQAHLAAQLDEFRANPPSSITSVWRLAGDRRQASQKG